MFPSISYLDFRNSSDCGSFFLDWLLTLLYLLCNVRQAGKRWINTWPLTEFEVDISCTALATHMPHIVWWLRSHNFWWVEKEQWRSWGVEKDVENVQNSGDAEIFLFCLWTVRRKKMFIVFQGFLFCMHKYSFLFRFYMLIVMLYAMDGQINIWSSRKLFF